MNHWSLEEEEQLRLAVAAMGGEEGITRTARRIATKMGRSEDAVRSKIRRILLEQRCNQATAQTPKSPYPRYDAPLVAHGDVVVLADVETPFHHAAFIDKVIALARAWQVRQCVLAGDFLHFDSLSSWGKNWINGSSEEVIGHVLEVIQEIVGNIPADKQERIAVALESMRLSESGDGMSSELRIARRLVKTLENAFDRIYYVLGNHEGRLLRRLDTTLNPEELLRLLGASFDKWFIAPYYYMEVISRGEIYSIEHQASSSATSASRMASAQRKHVIAAHSHILSLEWDASGGYYAIMAGHCVDESRLPYASQRHRPLSKPHKLGAIIIKDGHPWMLHEASPWEVLAKLY